MKLTRFLTLFLVLLLPVLRAELTLPAIIGDHMVLQQKQANPIWGWDKAGAKIAVKFAGKTYRATAGADGRWTVKLDAQPANATPQTITITGSSKRVIQDVLFGEVWMCSGQSNMGWTLEKTYTGDLEGAVTKHPNLRLISVPQVGTQELKNDFKGAWEAATPESVKQFSAVGLLYGRMLHEILEVPVGLIDNAWGGSSAEAWVRRETLDREPKFAALMAETAAREAELQSAQGRAASEAALAKWEAAAAQAKLDKKPAPAKPGAWLNENKRAGNIFAGVVHPTLGYGIKGVIWYQGESNATRAYEYRELFPFLIEQWRKEWGQGDFPFYWVQLADYKAEKPEPGESDWAELREAQTMALKLPNTGQAVITDLGEGRDIHPRNKYDVAARLVRWALVKDYGLKFFHRSPEFKSVSFAGNKATLSIDCFGGTLGTFDRAAPTGFAICGEDKVWHWATAKIVKGEQIEVWSDKVAAPVAVRYAWADNPVCNVFSKDGLPLTPFRTDDFEPITKPKSALVTPVATH